MFKHKLDEDQTLERTTWNIGDSIDYYNKKYQKQDETKTTRTIPGAFSKVRS